MDFSSLPISHFMFDFVLRVTGQSFLLMVLLYPIPISLFNLKKKGFGAKG